MTTSSDEIHEFIPNTTTKLVILGTMASGVARTKDQKKPGEAFFYQDNRNKFWEILQFVVNPKADVKKNMPTTEKKDFLNKWQIAMANIVATLPLVLLRNDRPRFWNTSLMTAPDCIGCRIADVGIVMRRAPER